MPFISVIKSSDHGRKAIMCSFEDLVFLSFCSLIGGQFSFPPPSGSFLDCFNCTMMEITNLSKQYRNGEIFVYLLQCACSAKTSYAHITVHTRVEVYVNQSEGVDVRS